MQDAIDYVYVSTPAAHECYLNAQQGTGYDLNHIRQRFDVHQSSLLRSDSGIDGIPLTGLLLYVRLLTVFIVSGLYLVGQDVAMAGLVAASLSAIVCVNTVLGYKIWRDLHNLMEKDTKKKADLGMN